MTYAVEGGKGAVDGSWKEKILMCWLLAGLDDSGEGDRMEERVFNMHV